MSEPISAEEQSNYETFRDCFSEPVLKVLAAPVEKPKMKQKRHAKRSSKEKDVVKSVTKAEPKRSISTTTNDTQASDAADLGEFIEYLSSLIFPSLPPPLRSLTYTTYTSIPSLTETYSLPLSHATTSTLLNLIPPTALDSLTSYTLLPTPSHPIDLQNFLIPVFSSYITSTTSPPPIYRWTRPSACELCDRDWVPLTYHHLIPKSVHEKVRKRGWHADEVLGSVAWLCRACHSFVHGLASNEMLAREWYTVELIQNGGQDGERRVEVEKWVKWVGGVRWKSR